MATYYFDANALIKYYIIEPGSAWIRQLIDDVDPQREIPRHTILMSEISKVEVAAGLAILERVGRIRKSMRDREYQRFVSQLSHRYSIIPITTVDIEAAAVLTHKHALKAYDAVQLATAIRY